MIAAVRQCNPTNHEVRFQLERHDLWSANRLSVRRLSQYEKTNTTWRGYAAEMLRALHWQRSAIVASQRAKAKAEASGPDEMALQHTADPAADASERSNQTRLLREIHRRMVSVETGPAVAGGHLMARRDRLRHRDGRQLHELRTQRTSNQHDPQQIQQVRAAVRKYVTTA